MLVDELIHSAVVNKDENFELLHAGVKGMKWGVRKQAKNTTKKVVTKINKLDKYEKQYQKYGSKIGKLLQIHSQAQLATAAASIATGTNLFEAQKNAKKHAVKKAKNVVSNKAKPIKKSYEQYDIKRKQKKGGIATRRPDGSSNISINDDLYKRLGNK